MANNAKPETTPDLWTIIAIAMVAGAVTDVVHEGLGHGGMCLATGGKALALSTVHFECSAENRLVAAGGTLANLVVGALACAMARRIKKPAHARYFIWLLMTFNLLGAGGYFLFSGIGNIGDWAAVVAGRNPAWAWRVGLTALGMVTYFLLFVPLCVRELKPFLPGDAVRLRRARQLTIPPYFATGILGCIAGALNPVGPMLVLVSAAAASFGGNSGMTWMWTLLKGERGASKESQTPAMTRSRLWLLAGAVVAVAFIIGLGPGVKFH